MVVAMIEAHEQGVPLSSLFVPDAETERARAAVINEALEQARSFAVCEHGRDHVVRVGGAEWCSTCGAVRIHTEWRRCARASLIGDVLERAGEAL